MRVTPQISSATLSPPSRARCRIQSGNVRGASGREREARSLCQADILLSFDGTRAEPTGLSLSQPNDWSKSTLRVDVVEPRHADERERPVDVAGRSARASARRRARPPAASAHEPRAADEAGAGAERARLDDVLAAPDAAVEEDLGPVADRLDDRPAARRASPASRRAGGRRGSRRRRRRRRAEPPRLRVAHREDALDDERPVPEPAQPVEVAPTWPTGRSARGRRRRRSRRGRPSRRSRRGWRR